MKRLFIVLLAISIFAQMPNTIMYHGKLTDTDEKRKVYEFGKYWPIRFWDWAG